jgi:hypothetical protein|tara:strand:+ start:1442 stop:1714 length:273 start_codon:yes stop_codon:yes gene_type:complete
MASLELRLISAGGYVVKNCATCNDITICKTRVQLVDNRLKVTDLRDPYDSDDPGNADHVLDHLKFCPRLRLWVPTILCLFYVSSSIISFS